MNIGFEVRFSSDDGLTVRSVELAVPDVLARFSYRFFCAFGKSFQAMAAVFFAFLRVFGSWYSAR